MVRPLAAFGMGTGLSVTCAWNFLNALQGQAVTISAVMTGLTLYLTVCCLIWMAKE